MVRMLVWRELGDGSSCTRVMVKLIILRHVIMIWLSVRFTAKCVINWDGFEL